jgi:hypothetical protein
MAKSINQHRNAVQHAFEQALAIADRDTRRSFHEFERALWSALLELGRALVLLFLARAVARPRATTYKRGAMRFVVTDKVCTTALGTLFGKVPFVRPVARPMRAPRGKCDLPVDRELGLCSGFSLAVVLATTRLCAQMAFAPARQTLEQFCEWAPSPRATLRMVDAVGAEARGFLEQTPPPPDDGDILVIQVDGRGAPMIDAAECERRRQPRRLPDGTARHRRRGRRRSRVRPRRKKGDKSKNAKVAFVGVIYTLQSTDDGCEGPIGKRLYATFESHEALFKWLHTEAMKRGYGTKRTLFLADGADIIWDLQQRYFPNAKRCLDWFHVVEKLWDVARRLHPEGSTALTAWVNARTRELRQARGPAKVHNALTAALQSVSKTGPGTKAKRDKILEVMMHLSKHHHRMRYHELRRDDLDIGSGAVEGAVRNLVGMRLDGPGMRWSRDRAEHVLHLRCILLNGQWHDFEDYIARRALRLAAQPAPTRTHDAKRKAA